VERSISHIGESREREKEKRMHRNGVFGGFMKKEVLNSLDLTKRRRKAIAKGTFQS